MEENLNVQGVEGQESAAPDTTATEPVNPTETATEATSTTENATESTTEPTADNEKGETKDINAIMANIRRKAEEDAEKKYAKKYEADMKRINDRYKERFGTFTNKLTGKAIETPDDYLDALAAEELQSKGIDPKMIEYYVNNSPVVKQAQEIAEQAKAAEQERVFDDAIKAINKLDPSVKTREDLYNHPSYPKVYELVSRGMLLEEAFDYANKDALFAKKLAAAQQAAINQAKGKNHLEATSSGHASNDEMMDVPSSTMAAWKNMNPGMTETEIKVKYNELMKKIGG